MSLLMQALKKAEHAKQKQNDPLEPLAEQEAVSARPAHASMSLAPLDAPAATSPPTVQTQPAAAPYPEIAAPQEQARAPIPALAPGPAEEFRGFTDSGLILEPTAAGASPAAEIPAPPAALTAAPVTAAAATGYHKPAENTSQAHTASAQQSARTVFASKQRPGARRTMSLVIAGIALTACALAGFTYYYSQFNSGSSNFANNGVSPPAPAGAVVSSAAPAAEAAVVEAAPDAAALARDPAANPAAGAFAAPTAAATAPSAEKAALPGTPAAAVPAAHASAENITASGAAYASPRQSAPMADAAPPQSDAIRIRQGDSPNSIHPSLTEAYRLFSAGDMTAAQQQYRRVLRQEPNNRDALLGMAAIAVHRQQADQAGAFYARLLELDPADADAMAGLASLKQGDPTQSESNLKKILAQDPQAGAALFALGNLYAQQARWPEAQQYYFRAFGSAQDNADYAFNLAVSLDRLGQGKLALEYYQRALALARHGQASFDQSVVQRRALDLKATLGG